MFIGIHEDICETAVTWRTKCGGMEVSDAKRLKELEDENRRLKQMLADTMLENRAMKDVLAKKSGRACCSTRGDEFPAGESRAQRTAGL